MERSIYRDTKEVFNLGFAAGDIFYMRPETSEKKHYHNGLEVVFVLDGNCETHQKGKLYFYPKGKAHEVINDSSKELVLFCLTIPPESKENTVFI